MRVFEDLKQYSQGSVLHGLYALVLSSDFHSVVIYRIAHMIGRIKILAPASKLLMYINRVLYSVDIDYRADIAGGLMLIHGIGTVLGLDVRIEGPVRIYQGVTLGAHDPVRQNKVRVLNGRTFSQPWIMPNASIYANASIIGPVIIGTNSVIGANCIITKDVPDGTTVYLRTEIIMV